MVAIWRYHNSDSTAVSPMPQDGQEFTTSIDHHEASPHECTAIHQSATMNFVTNYPQLNHFLPSMNRQFEVN